MYGVIFDVPRQRQLARQLEAEASKPDFWSDQEKAQQTLQQRKAVDERLGADDKLTRIASDIETYLSMARKKRNVDQRDDAAAHVPALGRTKRLPRVGD